MYYPKKISIGDTIEIIAPSNGIHSKNIAKLEKAINYLVNHGYKVIEGCNVRKSKNGASADKKSRALELNEAFKRKESSLLLACTGGDYCIQILDLVDFNLFQKNRKWVQGQSDITSILYYITTRFDVATMYSFNCKRISKYDFLPSDMYQNNFDLLNDKELTQQEYKKVIGEDMVTSSKWECICEEKKSIRGRIIGGCLECLKDIIGTRFDYTKKFIKKYSTDGIIWYFDVSDMSCEDILRTMWQFKNSGWFIHTKAILFGRLYEEKSYTGIDLKTALLDSLEDLHIPIIINVNLGHTDPVISIVNGSIVEINKDDNYSIQIYFE